MLKKKSEIYTAEQESSSCFEDFFKEVICDRTKKILPSLPHDDLLSPKIPRNKKPHPSKVRKNPKKSLGKRGFSPVECIENIVDSLNSVGQESSWKGLKALEDIALRLSYLEGQGPGRKME